MLDAIPMIGGVRNTPIPASLLPSTMDVEVPVEDDEHGGSYTRAATIANVRFVREASTKALSDAGAPGGAVFADSIAGTVYIDAENSAGAFEVPPRSIVSIDGGEPMEAVRTSRYDHFDGTPHHWEVEVR